MKKLIILLIITLGAIMQAKPQISKGGLPYTWKAKGVNENLDTVALKVSGIPRQAKSNIPKGETFTFAQIIDVNKNINEIGQWDTLPNGDKLWRVMLKSAGAYSLNFTFSQYLLPEGAEVYVYSPDHKFKVGAFTSVNNKEWGSLAVSPIPGDEIIIEYYEPKNVEFCGLLTIGSVGHDYLNVFGSKDGQFGASGDCNIDINCPEGANWQVNKRAVCRMIIHNSTLCTGALINNTNQDQTPYILTANHCIDNPSLAQNTVFYFNYESPSCGGADGSTDQSISGAELVATKNKDKGFLDFTLLKLSASVPLSYKPYFAGWDSRDITPTKGTCIHHPWGDVKKISQDFDSPDAASYVGYGYDPMTFWRINSWDKGTTEGGSSGSPMFDQNKRIVGSLSGGFASCETDSCDFFQMFSASYNKYSDDSMQLKHWLDPTNTGVAFLDGLDSYVNTQTVSDEIAVAHFAEGQRLAFYVANDGGYLSGNNIYQDKAKAEFFNRTEFGDRNAIVGANIAYVYATGNDNENIEVQILRDAMGSPSTSLGSAFASLGDIKKNADKDYTHYSFDPPVEVNGSVYLSVVLPQNAGDTVALMTVEKADVNTAWELNYNNEWHPYSDPDNSWGISLSHLIILEIGKFTDINSPGKVLDDYSLYPNPANQDITVEFKKTSNSLTLIEIYDTYGRLVLSQQENPGIESVSLDISELKTGFYICRIKSGNQVVSKKFIKK